MSEQSAPSFYLKMEAADSSKMMVATYKNQESLIITPAFIQASLSAHSHVNCVVKWSKTHIMQCEATTTITTHK
jgi:hypothetical protein